MSNQPGFQRQVSIMPRIEVYQFWYHDENLNENQVSKRWGTLEGIERIKGKPILESKVLVDQNLIGHEIPGLSAVGFVPDTSW